MKLHLDKIAFEEIIIENRSSKDLKKEDLIAIAKVKKIAMNLRYMEEL